MRAAMVKNGEVINLIVVEIADMETLRSALIPDDCDHLILVDDTVCIGYGFDEETSVFFDENGMRVYPHKTDSERIAELKTEISELQDAMVELAGILTESEAESDG